MASLDVGLITRKFWAAREMKPCDQLNSGAGGLLAYSTGRSNLLVTPTGIEPVFQP